MTINSDASVKMCLPRTPGDAKGSEIYDTNAAFDSKVHDIGAVGEAMLRGVSELAYTINRSFCRSDLIS